MTDEQSSEALTLLLHAAGVLDYFGTTDVDSQNAWREAKHDREAIRVFLKSLENEPKP